MKEEKIKKIIIVGGGLSGLTAGIYGQKNGYITEVFDKASSGTGLLTSWARKGMLIDGCIHWLTGTKENTQINDMWHDIDAFDQEDIIRSDNFGTVEVGDKKIVYWTDLKKFEKELLEISPEDKHRIHQLIKLIINIVNLPLPVYKPLSLMGLWELTKTGLAIVPYLKAYLYSCHFTKESYAKKFKSPILQEVIKKIVPGDGNLYTALYAYGTIISGNGGVPKGGSLAMSNRIVNTYKRLGGVLHRNCEVKKILQDGDNVVGIQLTNGEKHYADYVISCCDAYSTFKTLLDDRDFDKSLDKRYSDNKKYPAPSCVYASYSISVDKIKELKLTSSYEFNCKPFKVGNSYTKTLKFHTYFYDPTFVKNGRTVLTVLIHQNDRDYSFWRNLGPRRDDYLKTKLEIANVIKNEIENHFPLLKDNLDILDVATPLTYNRYVNSYHGAYMCFAFTNKGSMLFHKGVVKHLHNFYLGSQWTQMPGGLPIALMSGKFAIQRILKKDNKPYNISRKIYSLYK